MAGSGRNKNQDSGEPLLRGSRVAANQAVAVDPPSSRDGRFGIRALLGRVDAYADQPGAETAPAKPRDFDTEVLAGAIRQHVVRMTHAAGTSHVGSMLSMTDLVVLDLGAPAGL